MPKHKVITEAAASRLKAPKQGQEDHFCGQHPGLSLRIAAGGRRVWTYHFRIHGKQRRMTFGLYPALSVSEARDRWRDSRKLVEAGKDPAADPAEGTSTDVELVIAEWLCRD